MDKDFAVGLVYAIWKGILGSMIITIYIKVVL